MTFTQKYSRKQIRRERPILTNSCPYGIVESETKYLLISSVVCFACCWRRLHGAPFVCVACNEWKALPHNSAARLANGFSAICGMQIPRFTSSKPSEFAFASDEKSIRQPTASLCGVTLNLPLTNHIPKEALSSPLPGKGALTHHLQADGGIPPVGRARALSDGEFRSLRRATGNSANLIPCTKNAAAGRSTAAAFFVMTQHCR